MRARARLAVAMVSLLAIAAAPPRHGRRKRSRPPAAAAEAPPPAAPAFGPVTGPVADYWMSASTSSGFGAAMAAGARPSIGVLMRMAAGRGPRLEHGLTLQLASSQRPERPPQADHLPPAGLGVGASLPLTSPSSAQTPTTAAAEAGAPQGYSRPRGKLLMYWGCGEHVGPGQPVVLDFATLDPHEPLPDLAGAVRVAAETPPSPQRSVSYGRWPGAQAPSRTLQTGSLVGRHEVRGDYTPTIRFEVGPDMDFMAPLDLAVGAPTSGAARRLVWRAAPGATGYHLMLVAAQGGRERDAATMVVWSSSAVKPGVFGAGLADYLPPDEVARLVGARAVLAPNVTACAVPTEVTQAAPIGVVTAIGYGPEKIWTDPPRPASGPWPIEWRARLRLKTTATLLLRPGVERGPDASKRARNALNDLRPF